jgi:hypothetical protein
MKLKEMVGGQVFLSIDQPAARISHRRFCGTILSGTTVAQE